MMAIVPQKAANGSISIVVRQGPGLAPRWAKDKGIKLFQSILRKYGNENQLARPEGRLLHRRNGDGLHARQHAQEGREEPDPAELDERGDAPDRTWESLLCCRASSSTTTPTSRYPITQVRLQRWSKGAWRTFGPLVSAKPG